MPVKKVLTIVAVVLVGAAVVAANLWYARDTALDGHVEAIKARDLEAIVSASGKIQPKRLVNISADTPGRVVDLAVNEGDRVTSGQFLLQIDPKSLRTRVDSGTASLQAAEASLEQMRQSVETARVQLEQASAEPRAPAGAVEPAAHHARSARTGRERREGRRVVAAGAREAGRRRRRRASSRSAPALESARYDLSKVRIESPIDGIVTRRNIQEGETAVIGTMNNAGTVLLTLADMSVIQAEVEVDETNIPQRLARPAGEGDHRRAARQDVHGTRHRDRQQPDSGAPGARRHRGRPPTSRSSSSSTSDIPDVRPGFTCTADITTATRKGAVAVPIPAVAVRELVYDDANGQIVRDEPRDRRRRRAAQDR